MKNAKTNAVLRCVCVVFLSFSFTAIKAQDGLNKRPNVFVNSNCNGYLEYLPIGYSSNTTQKYPLIVYLNGLGSTGDGSIDSLEMEFSGGNYPHEQQRAGTWPDTFTVNSQTFQFVVITPQFRTSMVVRMPSPEEVDSVISFAISHYQIDTTRIYLMGSSQGGGIVWEYAGASPIFARRIAAMIPFSGVSWPVEERANIIKHSRVAVWAFAGKWDNVPTGVPSYFTTDYVNFINQDPAPVVPARVTLFPTTSHLIWPGVLDPSYTEGGINIYQWLLLHQRQFSKAHAGYYQELVLPNNSVQLHGQGTGPNGTVSSYNWQKISGPEGASFNNAILNPTVTNLKAGLYTFRLTIRDNTNAPATDDVEVFVNPSRQGIEAENPVAMSGFIPSSTVDPNLDGTKPGTRENGIDAGDWGDYTVNVPIAGSYKFKFRLGSFYGSTYFVVKNSSGSILLDSIPVFSAGTANNNSGWDSSFTVTRIIPLTSGNQTIRIQSLGNSIPNQPWYLNWFQVENTPVSASVVLPVNFTLFNAQCMDGGVNLQWKTAGELNSKDFSVEKSSNGRDWQVLATVPAAGNNAAEHSYSTRDNSAGNAFYRLIQTDLTGRKTLSPVIKSDCGEAQLFGVYPNPVTDKAYLHISLQTATKLEAWVLDSKGAVIRRQSQTLPAGNSQLPVDLSGLPQGTYTLMVKWDNETRSAKVLKR